VEIEINELQKWNIAQEITADYNPDEVIKQLSTVSLSSGVHVIYKKLESKEHIHYSPIPYKVALIDFEGSPAILMGILIHDTIITYYIEDYKYLNEFYLIILEVFSTARDLALFGFSSYEQQEIMRIYISLNEQGYNLSKYEFIKALPIINLQKDRFESVAEALFTTNSKIKNTKDPLFRNIRIIDKLFTSNRIEEIIIHNRTCLLNESIILQRWMKHYNLSSLQLKNSKKER
jgi:hypothetical protein